VPVGGEELETINPENWELGTENWELGTGNWNWELST
jgi:hypothetical protein